jgi:hypothetical protein
MVEAAAMGNFDYEGFILLTVFALASGDEATKPPRE